VPSLSRGFFIDLEILTACRQNNMRDGTQSAVRNRDGTQSAVRNRFIVNSISPSGSASFDFECTRPSGNGRGTPSSSEKTVYS